MSRSSLWDDEPDPGPQPLRASWDPIEESARPPRRERQRPERQHKRRSAVGWFFHHYGWRAYAIPVLMALTVLTIIQIVHDSSATAASAQPPASSPQVTVVSGVTSTVYVTPQAQAQTQTAQPSQAQADAKATVTDTGAVAPDPNGTYKNLPSGVLPGGAAFVAAGKGTWHVVPGAAGPFGKGPTHKTYKIEVEDGIQSTEADKEFASMVDSVLSDPRSWIGSGNFTLQRVASGDVDFTIALTSQMTERKPELCGWDIHLEASCYARDLSRVSINNARWTRGAIAYNGDLGLYRIYAVNHEVGHALGFRHQPCGENGGLAPVMMQQSWSTSNNDLAVLDPQLIPPDGKVCRPNPYPYPRAGDPSGGPGTGVGVTTGAQG